MRVEWNSYISPVGTLTVVEGPDGPLVVEFPTKNARTNWADRLRKRNRDVTIDIGPCQRLTTWLAGYFRGSPRSFSFPEYLADYFLLEPSQVAVWRHLTTIPFGKTCSYDDLSQVTGIPPRAVGQVLGSNPLALLIPCHRVVGKQGGLVGYGGGLTRKRWLLNHELRAVGVVLS
jgi:O-6-methylguanine DNA methyltransferase